MKPAKKFDAILRQMSDQEAMAEALALAGDAGVEMPRGKTGKTSLRIVSRNIRLAKRDYDSHRTVLLHQLNALSA